MSGIFWKLSNGDIYITLYQPCHPPTGKYYKTKNETKVISKKYELKP